MPDIGHSVRCGVTPVRAQIPISGRPVPELSSLDTVMLQLMSTWNVPGAALGITVDGRLVFARGYGYANKETQEPVQPDSLFRLASNSKAHTAAAILKLIEQGKLTLTTTPFTTVLADLTPPSGTSVDPRIRNITIQQLLTHTAGWDDTLPGVPDQAFAYAVTAAQAFGLTPPATPETLIRYVLGQPLQHDPGSTNAYSNFGYIALGEIIARASGMDYETYVNTYIHSPAGIQRVVVQFEV